MPHWVIPIVAAPFVGSFLSVLIQRLPHGRDVAWRRSACPTCGHTLSPLDLFPIVSWLVLRAKCRYCGGQISAIYPIAELTALMIAVWAAATVTDVMIWPTCVLGWALAALAIIDFRNFILPDLLTLPLLLCGLGVAWVLDPEAFVWHGIAALTGFVVFAGLGWVYHRLRGREGLGLGDAKLLAAAGAWVSLTGLPSVVLWGSLSALAFALFNGLRGWALTRTTPIAFGTHLCLGIWLTWLYGPLQFF